jgi:hypothetical protein
MGGRGGLAETPHRLARRSSALPIRHKNGMPMKPETSRVVRRIAYLIEAVCMFGLLSIARRPMEPRRFAGLELRQWLSAGLALGLTLWVVGTVTLYWPRKKTPRTPE